MATFKSVDSEKGNEKLFNRENYGDIISGNTPKEKILRLQENVSYIWYRII